ncbi:MAG: TrkA family potassium uptake protein [Nitriliruptorales bacterium]|nr:TrkA family potassium uptake protein [Nitriliruptorales bacterium]
MHIVVGGCGRLGSEIAERLSGDPDNDVVVIDVDELAFDRLGSAFNGETLVGDVTDRDTLEQAGIDRAEGLIAVTRFDNANLMAVEIAEVLYGVPRAVARLFNPEREPVYRKLGVRYVSGTGVLAKMFLNEFREETFPYHLHFSHGDISVIDLTIDAGGHGMSVDDFELDGHLRIAAIERGARVFIPRPDDRLERGDRITAAARHGVRRQLEGLVNEPSRRERPVRDTRS